MHEMEKYWEIIENVIPADYVSPLDHKIIEQVESRIHLRRHNNTGQFAQVTNSLYTSEGEMLDDMFEEMNNDYIRLLTFLSLFKLKKKKKSLFTISKLLLFFSPFV